MLKDSTEEVRKQVENNGVSCLINMDNREIYLATAGEAISYLTD